MLHAMCDTLTLIRPYTRPLVAYCLSQVSTSTIQLGIDLLQQGVTATDLLERKSSLLLLSLCHRHLGLFDLCDSYLGSVRKMDRFLVQFLTTFVPQCLQNNTTLLNVSRALMHTYDPMEYNDTTSAIHELLPHGPMRFTDLRSRMRHYHQQFTLTTETYKDVLFNLETSLLLIRAYFKIMSHGVPEECIPLPQTLPFAFGFLEQQLIMNRDEIRATMETLGYNPEEISSTFAQWRLVLAEIWLRSGLPNRAWELLLAFANSHGDSLALTLQHLQLRDNQTIYVLMLFARCYLRDDYSSFVPHGEFLPQLVSLYEEQIGKIDQQDARHEGILGHMHIYQGLLLLDIMFQRIHRGADHNDLIVIEKLCEALHKLIIGVVELQVDDYFAIDIYKLIIALFTLHGTCNVKAIFAFTIFSMHAGSRASLNCPIFHHFHDDTIAPLIRPEIREVVNMTQIVNTRWFHNIMLFELKAILKTDLKSIRMFAMCSDIVLKFDHHTNTWKLFPFNKSSLNDPIFDDHLISQYFLAKAEEFINLWYTTDLHGQRLSNSVDLIKLRTRLRLSGHHGHSMAS